MLKSVNSFTKKLYWIDWIMNNRIWSNSVSELLYHIGIGLNRDVEGTKLSLILRVWRVQAFSFLYIFLVEFLIHIFSIINHFFWKPCSPFIYHVQGWETGFGLREKHKKYVLKVWGLNIRCHASGVSKALENFLYLFLNLFYSFEIKDFIHLYFRLQIP